MKKCLRFLFILILVFSTSFLFACEKASSMVITTTTTEVHNYVLKETIDATCKEEGYSIYICTNCNDEIKQDIVEPLGHEFGYYLTDDPTCTEDGIRRSICQRCGEIYSIETIPATGHINGEIQHKDPTCTDDGYDITYCEYCHKKLKEVTIQALGHTEAEPITLDATCMEEGYVRTYCSICEELLNEEIIPAKGHTSSDAVIIDATCVDEGSSTIYCSVCNEIIEQETIPALGHQPGDAVIAKKATCTEEGLSEIYCTVCNEKLSEEVIQALGHDIGTLVLKAATCTSGGTSYHYCKTCGVKTETFTTPMKDHTLIDIPAVDATCTKDGNTFGHKCSVCGEIIDGDETISALGHNYTITQEKTSYGHSYNKYYCDRCRNTYIADLNTDYTKLYGYNYLLTTYANGVQMCNLYKTLYDAAYAFTYSDTTLTKKSDDETKRSILKVVVDCGYEECENHTTYGLTIKEAAAVWNTMVHENPQFMFMYNGYTYGTSTEGHGLLGLTQYDISYFNLCISVDYYDPAVRKAAMEGLNKCSEEIAGLMDGVTAIGDKCKVIHDYIIDSIDYSYIEGTTTPNTEKWAHNLVGLAVNKAGVCECYAKAYLYYSYLYDIDSIIVYGNNHAWNMTEYNGKWYGIDCTWDDKKTSAISYTYFGATESKMTSSGHTPYSDDFGISYQFIIPSSWGTTAWVRKSTGVVIY